MVLASIICIAVTLSACTQRTGTSQPESESAEVSTLVASESSSVQDDVDAMPYDNAAIIESLKGEVLRRICDATADGYWGCISDDERYIFWINPLRMRKA